MSIKSTSIAILLLALSLLGFMLGDVMKKQSLTQRDGEIMEPSFVEVTIRGEESQTTREVKVRAEVADTNEKRRQGLSGRETLPRGGGMLFIFENPCLCGFWMKEMRFPLDIIWIDEEYRIVHIVEGVSPATFPETFLPDRAAKYVLEVSAGTVKDFEVTPGALVEFSDASSR